MPQSPELGKPWRARGVGIPGRETSPAPCAVIPVVPNALQYALPHGPQVCTVGGRAFCDCYRDLVSNVVLINPRTGDHLARWTL